MRKPMGVFGERLSGDAKSLHGEAARFEGGLGDFQEFCGFGNLELVARAFQAYECSYASDFGLRRFGLRRFGLRRDGDGKKNEEECSKPRIEESARVHIPHIKAEMPVIFSPMTSLWMSFVPS